MLSIQGFIVLTTLFVVFVSLLVYSNQAHKKRMVSQEELLRFFAENEKLTVVELSIRIEQRTGGFRKVWDINLYRQLDELVAKGKLCKEENSKHTDKVDGGLVVVKYFLPTVPK